MQVRKTYRNLKLKRGQITEQSYILENQIERHAEVSDKLRIVGLDMSDQQSPLLPVIKSHQNSNSSLANKDTGGIFSPKSALNRIPLQQSGGFLFRPATHLCFDSGHDQSKGVWDYENKFD